MMKILIRLSALILFASAHSAMAANWYVRASADGGNNGVDWANAYRALPATLIRGDTYFVASGSYPSYTFDDAQSGNLIITIKKATPDDHGTDAGWQGAYGVGQAIFNSELQFSRGYYVLDGQTRNESDWFDGSAYGFRVNHNNRDQNIVISGGSSSSNIMIKHVFVDAIYQSLPSNTVRRYAIDTDTYGGSITTNLVFHRMYVYGSNNVWFLRTTNGAIVEYSASNGVAVVADGDLGLHPLAVVLVVIELDHFAQRTVQHQFIGARQAAGGDHDAAQVEGEGAHIDGAQQREDKGNRNDLAMRLQPIAALAVTLLPSFRSLPAE